jgi:hypothetical protein
MAIAIVVTIFVFPQTANHAFLGTRYPPPWPVKILLDAQEDLLTAVPGSIYSRESENLAIESD